MYAPSLKTSLEKVWEKLLILVCQLKIIYTPLRFSSWPNANLLYLLIVDLTAMWCKQYVTSHMTSKMCQHSILLYKFRYYYAAFFSKTRLVLSYIFAYILPKKFPEKFRECAFFLRKRSLPKIFLRSFENVAPVSVTCLDGQFDRK